jgi:hypothetical protein
MRKTVILLIAIFLILCWQYARRNGIGRPPFSNEYGKGITGVDEYGWVQKPFGLMAKDRSRVFIDSIDNVLLVLSPRTYETHPFPLFSFEGKEAVVSAQGVRKAFPWVKNSVVLITEDGISTKPGLAEGTARSFYERSKRAEDVADEVVAFVAGFSVNGLSPPAATRAARVDGAGEAVSPSLGAATRSAAFSATTAT